MKTTLATLLATASVVSFSAAPLAAADQVPADDVVVYQEADRADGVKIGSLSCDIGGGVGYVLGSSKSIDCAFTPAGGGLYQGATAEVTDAAGAGANLLVGGTSGSIHLQTVSVTGQLGLNLAATGTSVTLTPAG